MSVVRKMGLRGGAEMANVPRLSPSSGEKASLIHIVWVGIDY